MLLNRVLSDYEIAKQFVEDEIRVKTYNPDSYSFTITVNENLIRSNIDNVHTELIHNCVFKLTDSETCIECSQVIYRMIEYCQNRHPLMLDLNKLDYLDPAYRRRAIIRGCSMFKRLASCKNWLLHAAGLLPRELVHIVCFKTIAIFCAENRILPHYGNILVYCC